MPRKSNVNSFTPSKRTKRPGVHAKSKTSKLKSSKNYFKPNNDLIKNYWFKLDDIDLKKHTGKTFSPFMIFIQNGEQTNSYPIPKKISSDLPNNHLKYSLTWFSIAISILLIYLYFRKKNY